MPYCFADADELAGAGASSGAALIGFIQSGTGAVARTAQAKMREGAISVKDFGALGDGVTDDSAAIRNADAACGELRTLYFPAGTYLVKQDGANPWCLRRPASQQDRLHRQRGGFGKHFHGRGWKLDE